MSKDYRIIFCLPGNNFSGKFLDSWTNLLIYCINNGIKFSISRKYSSVVYYARAMCLGGNVLRGEDQKPFNGKIDYTHFMWIDSDIVFKPEDFQKLLDDDRDIVSGLYYLQGKTAYVAVENWDEEFFKQHGYFKFLDEKDAKKAKMLEVAYAGMGFMLVKKGVFESIKYPWFKPEDQKIGDAIDFASEDVSFCLRAKNVGYKIWIDTNVKVGHEKSVVLI